MGLGVTAPWGSASTPFAGSSSHTAGSCVTNVGTKLLVDSRLLKKDGDGGKRGNKQNKHVRVVLTFYAHTTWLLRRAPTSREGPQSDSWRTDCPTTSSWFVGLPSQKRTLFALMAMLTANNLLFAKHSLIFI